MSTEPIATSAAGAFVERRDHFAFSSVVFLRALALILAIAFLSFWVQFPGLVGPHGIIPAAGYLDAVGRQAGASGWLRLPTLCWFFGASASLHLLCAVGVVAAALLFAGIAPAVCLIVAWASYLSLMGAAPVFLAFQWDALLLETTLLAVFLAPWSRRPRWRQIEPPRLARGLLKWLLFRLIFLSGVVKLSSGDPTWRNLTALTYHYETQPLPNPVAWWAHQLPAGVQRASCAGMFAIELLVPFFLWAPRTLRHTAALLIAAFQVAIELTGNFAFFNLLTIALCLLCLDDAWWCWLSRRRLPDCHTVYDIVDGRGRWWRRLGMAGAVAVVGYTSLLALPSFGRGLAWPRWFAPVVEWVAPFSSFNNYGLFAVMTTSRPELIFEGSDDQRTWREYEFPYKPGNLARPPRFVAPYQPRLDWQLWFAALGGPDDNPWVFSLCGHLLRGTPAVLGLLARNPFPDHPPTWVRVVRYDYRFTTPAGRARTGDWWRRTPVDLYVPPISLRR